MPRSRAIWIAAICAPLLLPVSVSGDDCMDRVLSGPLLTGSLLNGAWEDVLGVFKEAPGCSLSTTAILLQGHAALATGEHNAAALLFLLGGNSPDLEAWDAWTQSFAETHPDAAAGYYLSGDAKARLAEFTVALQRFDKALEIDGDYFLAQNARGVVNSLLYQEMFAVESPNEAEAVLKKATADFAAIANTYPEFVDAPLNLGLAFLETERLPGAGRWLDQAISVDPNCGLAYNARAMLSMEHADVDNAQQDIVAADSLLPSFPLILWNAKALSDSGDTTSAVGRIAWIKGAGADFDTTRGFSMDAGQFSTGLERAIGGVADLVGFGGAYDIAVGVVDMFSAVDFNMDYGGVCFAVDIMEGTHLVGTNYALSYPRHVAGEDPE